jgi:hypothetical protein
MKKEKGAYKMLFIDLIPLAARNTLHHSEYSTSCQYSSVEEVFRFSFVSQGGREVLRKKQSFTDTSYLT